jgi:GntR family transcriptional regulator, carbon starvation induced regulator
MIPRAFLTRSAHCRFDMTPLPDTAASAHNARSLTTLAFERLRQDILSGALRPEERLRIQALSERYGIGATAIREALSRLVPDGLVASEDQRGFFVAPVSRDDLIDLTQTRIEIEQVALRLAAERGDVDWESQLLSCFHRLSRTEPPTSPERAVVWAQAHQQFHEALIAGCRSPWTLRVCRLLYEKSERYRNLSAQRTRTGDRDIAAEHRRLMDAAMARDAATACRLLSEHFWETTDIILKSGFSDARPAGAPRKAG